MHTSYQNIAIFQINLFFLVFFFGLFYLLALAGHFYINWLSLIGAKVIFGTSNTKWNRMQILYQNIATFFLK